VNRTARQIITLSLALLGVEIWIEFLHLEFGPRSRIFMLGLGVLALIPPVNRGIERLVRSADAWLRAHRAATALGIGLATTAYLLIQAWRFSEILIPTTHDEHVYLIQAHLLAHGRLWHAPYPPAINKFFDTFYLILDRVYAPKYFPGAALLMAPGIWLGWRFWVIPMLTAAVATGLLFLVSSQILADPLPTSSPSTPGYVRGLIAVVMLLSLRYFRMVALMALSEAPFLMMELLLLWTWLRWRAGKGAGLAWFIGAAAGFAAIMRPLDAVCFALPIGVAMMIELIQQARPPAILMRTAAMIVLGALPFLGLQVVQNIGVTGKWYSMPEILDYAANYPAPPIGFYNVNPAALPHPTSPARQAWLKWVLESYYLKHEPAQWRVWFPLRIRQILLDTTANGILVVLVPLGLISLAGVRRWVIFASLILFVIAYTAYVFNLEHYAVTIMPAMSVLILLGWQSLDDAWPAARRAIDAFMLLAVMGFSFGSLPVLDHNLRPFMRDVAEQ